MSEGRKISGATLSLIAVAVSELRRDTQLLVDSGWSEPVRLRAHELASTLAEACDRHGLKDVALHCRSVANLARLAPEETAPLEGALREKFETLHRDIQGMLSKHSKKHIG